MLIANALSQAFDESENKETDSSLNEVVHTINISNNKKEEFLIEIEKNPILKLLKETVLNGWPKVRNVPIELRFYFNKRCDIFYDGKI